MNQIAQLFRMENLTIEEEVKDLNTSSDDILGSSYTDKLL